MNTPVYFRFLSRFGARASSPRPSSDARWGALLIASLPHLLVVAGDLDLAPKIVGQLETSLSVARITVAGTRAYWTSGFDHETGSMGTLHVGDVSDPSAPRLLGSLGLPRPAWGVAVAGDYAYVADESAGLIVVNVAEPAAPVRRGVYNTSGSAYDVVLVGHLAYVADGESGLVVVDVTDPAAPRRVGSLDGSGEVHQVTVSGSYAYLADRFWSGTDSQPYGALRIVDVSNPASPRHVGRHRTQGGTVAVVGNIAYMGGENYDVSDPANPRLLASHAPAGDLVVQEGRAFVAEPIGGLQILDVADPLSRRRIGGLRPSRGYARHVAVQGRYAYLMTGGYVNGEGGLHVIDIEAPATWERLGGIDTPGTARAVAVSGSRAYVADGTAGLQILDLAEPTRLVLLGNHPTPNPAEWVAAKGNIACVVGNTWITDTPNFRHTLEVLDVSDPRQPRLLGTYVTAGYTQFGSLVLNATGEFAFLALGAESGEAGRVDVVDLRKPSSPTRIANHDFSSMRFDQTIRGEYLFVGDGMAGLTILDVHEPSLPVVLGSHEAISWNLRVATSGSRAFLSGLRFGFQVLDVSVPTGIALLGTSSELGFGWNRMAAVGHRVFAAAGGSGLQVVDTSVVSEPVLVGENAAVLANDLAVSGNYVLVAADDEGVQVFGVEPRSSLVPSLAIARTGNSLAISWPVSFTNFALERSDSFTLPSNWQREPTAPEFVGGRNVVTLEVGSAARFFRLRRP